MKWNIDKMVDKLIIDRNKNWEHNYKAIFSQIHDSRKTKRGTKIFEAFEEWLKNHPLKYPFFSCQLYWRAFVINQELKDNDDHLTVITGREGIGKSTLGLQFAAVISAKTFGITHVCYTLLDLAKVLRKVKKGDTIVCDEGLMFSFSREAISSGNKQFVKLLSISRQLNIHLIINVPNFWNLESYVREHRVKTLINVTERGYCNIYTHKSIRYVSLGGSKNRLWEGVSNEIWKDIAKFSKRLPEVNDFNEETYLQLKKEHMNDFLEELEEFAESIEESSKSKRLTIKDAANKLGVARNTIQRLIERGELKGIRICSKWFVVKESLENYEKNIAPVSITTPSPPTEDRVK